MKILLAFFKIVATLLIIGWWLVILMAVYGAWLYFSGNGRP